MATQQTATIVFNISCLNSLPKVITNRIDQLNMYCSVKT